jgi:NADPH:quinone reductase-like Zn-dependent oxidoreductase
VAGTIDLLGPGVTGLTVGEAVFGLIDFPRDGCAAEYAVAPARAIAPKPLSKDYVQAAAVPLSALTAWQALVDHAKLEPGQRVLVQGGAGGVGSFAVQIAKWKGAHVLATASTKNAGFLRKLGVEEVIDYSKTQFYEALKDLDVVLDTVGGETLARSWSILKPGGILVSIVSEPQPVNRNDNGVHGVFFVVKPNQSELSEIGRLLDAGEIRPVIGSVLPLAQARKAFEKGLRGHNRGKLILHVAD